MEVIIPDDILRWVLMTGFWVLPIHTQIIVVIVVVCGIAIAARLVAHAYFLIKTLKGMSQSKRERYYLKPLIERIKG